MTSQESRVILNILVLEPTSQCKPERYQAPSAELNDSFKVGLRNGQAEREGADEETAFRKYNIEDI